MVAKRMPTPEVAILGGRRTPFVRSGTLLASTPAAELARVAMQETLYHCNCEGDRLDEVVFGNVVTPADAANIARVSALWAGIPQRIPAMTVQRNCASGMEAVGQAMMKIQAGGSRIILAGGVESMSKAPLLFPDEAMAPLSRLARARTLWQRTTAVAALRPRHFKPVAALQLGLTDATCGMIMGKTAEVLAHEFGISRKEQDLFALESHRKAVAAREKLDEEIVTVFTGGKFEPVAHDNGPRPQQNMDALSRLPALFDRRDGTVTAGNSCQISDGAAALLVTDADIAGGDALGFIRGYAFAALDPAHMGLGPVFAIDALLKQTGMKLSDIDLFEINEAFAAQVLACLKAMNSAEFCRKHLDGNPLGEIDPGRLNVNGGAIALGHPVGATGARIVLTLLMEMRRRAARFGVAALCVGGGQGAAMLLERK